MTFQVLALGANPAYQKLTEFKELQISKVNRATSLSVLAAGKGQNLARSVNAISPGVCAVAHFLGGATGKWINENLKMASGECIPQLVSWTESQTRTCTTLKDLKEGTVTELIDPSGNVSEAEVENLLHLIKKEMSSLKVLAICGTFPPGADELYLNVAKIVKGNQNVEGNRNASDCLLYLDGYKKVDHILPYVDIYKIALYELLALVGANEPQHSATTAEVKDATNQLFNKYSNLKWVAITDGPERSYLFANSKILNLDHYSWSYAVKALAEDEIVNPIGAGDTVGGVMIAKFMEDGDMVEAFRWGLAAATAKCKLAHAGGVFSEQDLQVCLEGTLIHKLSED